MRATMLKVGEMSDREDYGRGVARMDSSMMKELGMEEGNAVKIFGKRETLAVAVRSYPADVGLNVIRIDGLMRKNAKTSIGETVTVKKAKTKEAKKVILAPVEKGVMLHIHPNLLKQNLFGRPMVKGDIIIANPVFKTSKEKMDVFEQFFKMDSSAEVFFPFGSETKLVVMKTEPGGAVQITDLTEIELKGERPEKMPKDAEKSIKNLCRVLPRVSIRRVPSEIAFKVSGKNMRYLRTGKKALLPEEMEKLKGVKGFFIYQEKDGKCYAFKRKK